MNNIFAYRDNLALVATLFEVESNDPEEVLLLAKGLISYAEYLNTFVFNTYDQ